MFNEANYVSADNAVCTIDTNTSMDVLIQLYNDMESGSENKDDQDSENIEDSGRIQTYQDALRSIRYHETFFLIQRNEEMIPIIVTDLQSATEECLVN